MMEWKGGEVRLKFWWSGTAYLVVKSGDRASAVILVQLSLMSISPLPTHQQIVGLHCNINWAQNEINCIVCSQVHSFFILILADKLDNAQIADGKGRSTEDGGPLKNPKWIPKLHEAHEQKCWQSRPVDRIRFSRRLWQSSVSCGSVAKEKGVHNGPTIDSYFKIS